MPAFCRINNVDFKAIKIQETAAPLQPAALVAKKADFIIMYRCLERRSHRGCGYKKGIKLKRISMGRYGLDI